MLNASFQSTHPSGVRPAQETTDESFYISIHAPQWGATSPTGRVLRDGMYFNPRTPVGCDFLWYDETMANEIVFQSTHPSGVRPPLL